MRHVAGPPQGRSSDFRGLRAAWEAPDCLSPRAVSRKAMWRATPPELPFCATHFTVWRVPQKAANLSSAVPYNCRRPGWQGMADKLNTAICSAISCAI
jgi:hypothetical protein